MKKIEVWVCARNKHLVESFRKAKEAGLLSETAISNRSVGIESSFREFLGGLGVMELLENYKYLEPGKGARVVILLYSVNETKISSLVD